MKKKYLSLLSLFAIIPVLMFGVPDSEPQYNDGKLTTISSGLSADISDEKKMNIADIIVKGKIVEISTEVGYLDIDRGIVEVFSVYEIEPKKFIKGEAEGNIIVKVLGGETDDYRTISNDMLLNKHNNVMMHLTLSDDGTYYNVFGGVHNTYLLDKGSAQNAKQEYLSEQKLDSDYEKLAKKIKLSKEKLQ